MAYPAAYGALDSLLKKSDLRGFDALDRTLRRQNSEIHPDRLRFGSSIPVEMPRSAGISVSTEHLSSGVIAAR